MESEVENSMKFYQLLLSVLNQPNVDSIADLERIWKYQRIKLNNLLKHAGKSAMDRQQVQTASSPPGIRLVDPTIDGNSSSSLSPRQRNIVVKQQCVDEALILSDLFDMNEFEALYLALAGQMEMSNQPNWPSGLCAVYLFYKNRWYQAQSIKLLMRNRRGRYWNFDDPRDDQTWTHVRSLVSDMADQLWKDNLLANLLSALQTSGDPVQVEFEKLQQPTIKGLGDQRHRRLVADCIQETHAALGDALYYWCCQSPLDQREFAALIRFASENSSKAVRLPVVFSILQALDVTILETSDSEDDIEKYAPFSYNREILAAFNSELIENGGGGTKWMDVGAQSFVQMAWAISLRLIGQNPLTQNVMEEDWTHDEEDILNNALQLASTDISLLKSDIRGPFHWLRHYIVTCPEFSTDDMYRRRLHSFFTQLISSFPLKMKEWRSEADDECRQLAACAVDGIMPASPPYLHFEQFMLAIGEFYGAPSQLKLSEAYFCPVNHEPGTPLRRIPQSQIALFKFLRSSGVMLPSRLYVAYLRMLTGLSSSPLSARLCFEMLKSFSNYGGSLNNLSLDNFFSAIELYLRVLKASSSTSSSGAHIQPDEMRGLQAWFDAIARMAEQDDSIRLTLFEHPRWSCPTNVLGLITCAIPLELKRCAFRCLTALAQSQELALVLSEGLLASGIVSALSSTNESKLGGVQQELEEVESRLETYPITTGLVNFLATLCQHRAFSPEGPAMVPYVNFVTNSVLVHLMNRNYKSPAELWELATAVFRFIYNVIKNYEPTVASIIRQSIGCQVMTALTNDGPVFRTVCRIFIAAVQWLDDYKDMPEANKAVRETLLYCLKLLHVGVAKSIAFSAAVIDSGVPILTASLDVLLQLLNPQTGKADYVLNLAMILSHFDTLPEHCLYVVRIIDHLCSSVIAQTKIVKFFLSDQAVASRILNGFESCLAQNDIDARFETITKSPTTDAQFRGQTALAILELMISDLKRNIGSGSLAHFLTGFDVRRPSETKLENPGVDNTPRTGLHAVLEIADRSLGYDMQRLSIGALVEPAYRLLYCLASSSITREATLRYLRAEYKSFVQRHVTYVRIAEYQRQQLDDDMMETTGTTCEVPMVIREVYGWLLKLFALELASVAESQPSYVTSLSKSLLMAGNDASYGPSDTITTLTALSTPGGGRGGSQRKTTSGRERVQRGRRLFEFVAALKPLASKYSDETVVVPRLQHFEGVRLSKMVAACTIKTSKGYYRCDVVRLYDILDQELVALQSNGVVGQLHLVKDEIQTVVDSLSRYNEVQQSAYVLRHAFAGFAQTCQLLFSVCPLDWMEPEQIDQVIIEAMVETMRSKVPAAAIEVADLLLSLTAILRRRFSSDSDLGENTSAADGTSSVGGGGRHRTTALLDGSMSKGGRKQTLSSAGILASALKLLIEATLKPENRRSDVRASLYGALMNFFRLWQKPSESDSASSKTFEPTVRERMAEEHWAIVNRYVGDLVDALAKDAADGSEVTKTVAMCCLVTLLEQDAIHGGAGRKAFIGRGYINAIKFPTQFQKWISMIVS